MSLSPRASSASSAQRAPASPIVYEQVFDLTRIVSVENSENSEEEGEESEAESEREGEESPEGARTEPVPASGSVSPSSLSFSSFWRTYFAFQVR